MDELAARKNATITLEELQAERPARPITLQEIQAERLARPITLEEIQAERLARQPNPWDALDEWIGDDATRTEGKRDLPAMRDGEDLTAYIERISKPALEDRE